MGKRHPNWRLIKNHRTYTAEDAAQTLSVHKNGQKLATSGA
jgi:hypothetical protein